MNTDKARRLLSPQTRWVCSSLVNTHSERMLRSDHERAMYLNPQTPLISREVQRKVLGR